MDKFLIKGPCKIKGEVSISGRVMALRKMGKASFIHIMDAFGQIQIFIKKDTIGEKV